MERRSWIPPSRLYVVTHRELSPGYQAVQAAHAAIDFTFKHPSLANGWHDDNYLIVLAARDYVEMMDLMWRCWQRDVPTHAFREPDVGNVVTAFAALPRPGHTGVFKGVPLALKDAKRFRRRPRVRG